MVLYGASVDGTAKMMATYVCRILQQGPHRVETHRSMKVKDLEVGRRKQRLIDIEMIGWDQPLGRQRT